jgi:nitrogenase molybdenum-iron protein alpha chain
MSYISPSPPIREKRLKCSIAYGGDARHVTSCGCTDGNRRFSQTTFCQQWLSLFTLFTIPDSVLIIHAPVGCAASMPSMSGFNRGGRILRGQPPRYPKWISTDLREAEVIHGGEEKLRRAIIEAERRYKPKLISVFTSCVSGIIADDVDAVAKELQEEIEARIIPVHCEGFKSRIWATGYDACFHALLKHIIKPPRETRGDLVNVINPVTMGRKDEIEVERLFSHLGLKANFAPAFASIEQIEMMSEAAASTSTCPTFSEYITKMLKAEYGIPYTQNTMPIGIEKTDQWLLEIAELTGRARQAEAFIEAEHERIKPQLERIRSMLEGKTAFISAGQYKAVAFASLARDLGLEVIGLTAYHYDEVIQRDMQDLAEEKNLKVHVANLQSFEQANLLKREKPDLFIGHLGCSGWALKLGIPTTAIFDYSVDHIGYNGVLEYGNKVIRALQNPSFGKKLQEHARLPYKKQWFSENPFRYIEEVR